MRMFLLSLGVLLGACAPGTTTAPLERLQGLVDPAQADRRAAVEIAVKATWPAILQEIRAGGGPTLNAAYDAAQVPAVDRPARTLQLSGDLALYTENPGALVLAISSFGSD